MRRNHIHRALLPWLCVIIVVSYMACLSLLSDNQPTLKPIQLPLFKDDKLFISLLGIANAAISRTLDAIDLSVTDLDPPDHYSLRLQQYLDCTLEHDIVRLDSASACLTHPNRAPSSKCSSLRPHSPDIGHQTSTLCPLIRNKTILLLGNQRQYQLHNVLLKYYPFPFTEDNIPCPGAQFCNWHAICSLSNDSRLDIEAQAAHGLSSDNRKNQVPSNHSHLSVLRYIQTASLFPSRTRKHRRYDEAHVSRMTGVRETESFWVPSVRGSDVIVLSKPPVSAPAWSYGSPKDYQLPPSYHDFLLRPAREDDWEQQFSSQFLEFIPQRFSNITSDSHSNSTGITGQDIIDLALDATFRNWLPTLTSTLISIQSDPGMRNKMLIWRGEWLAERTIGTFAAESKVRDLNSLLGLPHGKNWRHGIVIDPWVAFHDTQVVIQSLILRGLLLQLNIPYLPLYMRTAPIVRERNSADFIALHSPCTLSTVKEEVLGRTFVDSLAEILSWKDRQHKSKQSVLPNPA